MESKISPNNFDLIRLLAAAQVAVLHVLSYLTPGVYGARHGAWPAIITLLKFFPGVPIFFFISGFLISRSYERAGSIGVYAANRCLRIYPALHVCVLVNLVMVWATGYFHLVGAHFGQIMLLYLAKTTFVQFYNPQFMRHFGDGVLNGSLWTVCVELQFYLLIPVIYQAFSMPGRRRFEFALLFLIVLSIGTNRLLYGSEKAFGQSDWWKLVRVSFLPWLYMFLAGLLAQRYFRRLAPLLSKSRLAPCIGAYLAYALSMRYFGFSFDNNMSPLIFIPLAAVILLAAYSGPNLAERLLHGNDLSYGIYIYHVPVMDTLLYLGFAGSLLTSTVTFLATVCLAAASWKIVERPFLRKKRHSIHPVPAIV